MAKVSLRAYNREIEAMIDRGQLDEAVAHCQHILKTFPKHLETYRLLGKSYLEAKRQNEAVDIFSRVLAAEPSDFVSHVGMSIIRDEQGKLDDAIWHMERAYEVHSANAAIQAELQRLYGRRDGAAPSRIRMTRGALEHMYVRGELYPQAISETKGILEEDQGRSDMQVLLAKAYYRSGQKKDAADAASTVLKRYPLCLDANLVLADILGTDRPESAQVYRQRVAELDPYAAQSPDNMFRAAEVSDAAVTIEHLDWNGQPVGMSADWGTERAIARESGVRDNDTQPDWLKESFPAETSSDLSAPTFDSEQETSASPAQSDEDIPDFLREAGWGASTGSFDESKSSMFDNEPAAADETIPQGDLPDWVKAMAPQETSEPSEEAQEEEMPDWINKIGTEDLPVPAAETSDEQSDWLGGLDDASSSDDQPDWLTGLGEEEQAPAQSSDEQSDWMKGLEQEEQPVAQTSEDQPDLMKGFGEEEQPAAQTSDEQPDWMKGFDQEEQTAPQTSGDQPDWLKDFGSEGSSSDFDFLDEKAPETEESAMSVPSADKVDTGSLGTTEEEQDDSFAWLENLAAKQGATEGLLTKPEERLEDEPDWIKQAKSLGQSENEQTIMEPPQEEAPKPESVVDTGNLGTSEQERDDSFAWLEGLAAKQGATEGLLTKPEERKEQEPDWVSQVKRSTGELKPETAQQPPAQEEVVPEPETVLPEAPTASSVEKPAQSEQEIDDALAWFESLAAKQGATEGLLTKPGDRKEEEPEWVKQAKNAQQPPAQQQPPVEEEEAISEPEASLPEPPASEAEGADKSGQEIDDALAWFEGLAAKQGATEGLLTKPEDRLQEEPDWVKQAKNTGVEQPPVEEEAIPEPEAELEKPVEEDAAPGTETEVWLKGLAEEEEERATTPAEEGMDTIAWLKTLDEPEEEPITLDSTVDELPSWMEESGEEEAVETEAALPTEEAEAPVEVSAPVDESETEELPGWLSSLEEEEQAPSVPASDDLPAWMRDETGEVVAEPTKIEPTRSADWKPEPVEEEKVEEMEPAPPAATLESVQDEPAPEPKAESRPEKKAPPKAKKPAPKKEEVKPAKPPEPYQEPVTRRGTGMVNMPVDPILGSARAELSRSNIPGALETYGKLIKKGRFLEEVIYDLREALYRYPVEVSIWQTLGDAYMRANQLQDALDAYTKAEELLR